jgi:bifunctional non-homologous end joining protein LigD
VIKKVQARFIAPMLLLKTDALPDDAGRWVYQLKVDGYRAVAFKSGGRLSLRSRNDNDFAVRYPAVLQGLTKLPDESVIDGELVAFGADGKPSFNALQHSATETVVVYYVFDVLVLAGRDVTHEPLGARLDLLQRKILPKLAEPVRHLGELDAALADLVASVKAQGFEGLVAKRRDSRYEPGLRSGAWQKMRVNRGQEFVIGGYTVGGSTFDALILGYYDEDGRLVYAARTRNGFTPAVRAQLARKFKGLEAAACPFVNLPETRSGRWGVGLTRAKMADCRWLKPALVGQFEFLEWTGDNHLRHSKFIALRDDKEAAAVRREEAPRATS